MADKTARPQQSPSSASARDALRERLAAVAHDHWSEWATDLLAQTVTDQSGEVVLPAAVVAACQARADTSYAELPPADKEPAALLADALLADLDDAEPPSAARRTPHAAEKGADATT